MNSLASTVAIRESAIETHEGRFKFLHPILQAAHRCVSQLPILTNRLDALGTAVARGRNANVAPQSTMAPDPWTQSFAPTPDISPSSSSGSSSTPMPTIPDGEAHLNMLEHLVQSLEKRIVGDGIRMGRFLFQRKEDLRLWIVQHVKDNRFGLFLDAVSIFDFLAQAHIDSDTNMSHLYSSQKNGFDTTYESRIISSMQNLFPNLFGKSSSDGLDTSRALPGLQTPEKWNSEGVTGLQLQVERESYLMSICSFEMPLLAPLRIMWKQETLPLSYYIDRRYSPLIFATLFRETLSFGNTRNTPGRTLRNQLH